MNERFAPQSQPIFNLPPAATLFIAAILGIHLVRVALLSEQANLEVLASFAFIPVRVTDPAAFAAFPGGETAAYWSFVTYALLHADWGHVAINCLWLAAFGSPLAWRFGTSRFLLFSIAGAIGGAVLHLLTNLESGAPMVGASAAISAHMAGASRFVFTTGIPMGFGRAAPPEVYRRPAEPLGAVMRDRRVFLFLLTWFGINLVFGLAGSNGGMTSGAIAWQAHIGGFLVGLFLFPLFDPVGNQARGRFPPDDRDAA
jgi:membrane associated rhomboid family serine protease